MTKRHPQQLDENDAATVVTTTTVVTKPSSTDSQELTPPSSEENTEESSTAADSEEPPPAEEPKEGEEPNDVEETPPYGVDETPSPQLATVVLEPSTTDSTEEATPDAPGEEKTEEEDETIFIPELKSKIHDLEHQLENLSFSKTKRYKLKMSLAMDRSKLLREERRLGLA
jgi:hypothetical protein